jgi:two-component system sensor histidine kinase MprB
MTSRITVTVRAAGRFLRSPFRFWRRLPLRARLALAATVAVAAGIGGGVGYAYYTVHDELVAQVDAGISAQAERFQKGATAIAAGKFRSFDHAPQFGETRGSIQLVRADGDPVPLDHLVPSSLAARVADVPVSVQDRAVAGGADQYYRSIWSGGQHLRVLTAPLTPGLAVQIATPLTGLDNQLSALRLRLLVAGSAGIVLAALGGWLLTRAVLRPVTELTSAAERIATTHDLAHRIPDDVAGETGRTRDELSRLAASFNTMLDAVQEATDRQRQLVADASHELRTPLTSLRTNVEVLAYADRLDPEDREALVAGIMSGIDDLTALVSDTVELARGEEQAGQFEELRWDLLVQRCVDRAAAHWPAVRFKTSLQECVVTGVSDRLAKAIRNLLDNAAKFSPIDGLVEVESSLVGPKAVLTVRDHGPGIPAEDLPRVFDRFYRAASARPLPGSGLGLAIVAQVAGGHGGEVSAAAADGGGAEFRLAVPASRQAD